MSIPNDAHTKVLSFAMLTKQNRTARTSAAPLALTGVLLIAGAALGVTAAVYLTQDENTGNTFHAATVGIQAGDLAGTARFNMPTILPGDSQVATLDIENIGDINLHYSVTAQTSGPTDDALALALQLTVKSGVTACTAGGFAATGTTLYTGPLAHTGGIDVVGDPSAGQQASDRDIAAAATETLCLKVELPAATTDPALMGKDATVKFIVNGEQD